LQGHQSLKKNFIYGLRLLTDPNGVQIAGHEFAANISYQVYQVTNLFSDIISRQRLTAVYFGADTK